MNGWGDPSAGEIGGVFAGLVALLACVGKGFAWLLGWKERREQSRADKLQAWHEELDRREAALDSKELEYRAGIEKQLAQLWRSTLAIRDGYQLIAQALRVIDSSNPALRQADELLRAAFPLEPLLPPDMQAQIDKLKDLGVDDASH